MGHTKDTLGIIVNSNRYFEFVSLLAEAAVDLNKSVHIHMVGAGCQFAGTEACKRLRHKARITMCAQSVRRMPRGVDEGLKKHVSLVPAKDLTRLLTHCDRHVVF